MTTLSPTLRQPTSGPTPALRPAGLAVLLLGGFLPILDFFIVNVALPTMDATLHASASMLELVVAAYGVAYAVLLVVGGRLGDSLGRRRMFSIGLAGFTLSSLLCGFAPTVGVLVVARILQGLSAAMSQPQVLATVQATLDGPHRARAIGLYAAVAGVAASVGQLLGGVLVQADIAGSSWRPIFLVNAPIGLAVLLLVRRYVPATRSPEPASVDLPGTALLATALIALLIPLTEGRAAGWPAWMWLLLAAAPVATLAMVLVERRAERSGATPLLSPALLGLPAMRRGLLLGVPFFVSWGVLMFVFALTLQDGLHMSALRSGVVITPMMLGFLGMSLAAPRLLARYGKRVIACGLGMQSIALFSLVFVVARQWPHVSGWALAPGLAVAGAGQACGLVGLFRQILGTVPPRLAGVGSGVLTTLQQGSMALGVASLGSLFVSLSEHGFDHAFVVIMSIQVGIAVLVALGSLFLPEAGRPEQPVVAVE